MKSHYMLIDVKDELPFHMIWVHDVFDQDVSLSKFLLKRFSSDVLDVYAVSYSRMISVESRDMNELDRFWKI